MSSPAYGSEVQRAEETGKRARSANKACVPCRERKVKCDAPAIGLPCSSCTSRQCVKDCALPVRKKRTKKITRALLGPSLTAGSPALSASPQLKSFDKSDRSTRLRQSRQSSPTNHIDYQKSPRAEQDLLYLNILNEAVKEPIEPCRPHSVSSISHDIPLGDSFKPRNYPWTKLPQLEDIDKEYLIKKGVFDLPSPPHLDAFVKIYFDHVYPFSPVINRVDFIRSYQSSECSLFLLHVILTAASVHAPTDVLSACGFTSRSAAQESFFSKTKLLYDVAAEDDSLLILQGSIILCTVHLDHSTDRDFGYWFHNAIRLATKLDLRTRCIREEVPRKILKLYRRIWWALYSLDIFHVFVNTRRSRLLENTSPINPRTEDDWEAEDISGTLTGILSSITPQQRALPVVQCELSQIVGECLSIVSNGQQKDPRNMMQRLDTWRKCLAVKMHVGANTGTDVYYLNMLAMSYRFDCILCRLIRRRWQQSRHADWSDWAGQRLRSAILELDTIAMRVLASGSLQDFPISFITTLTALLALHIESVLDPTETDLVRSMARISISQTMLVLTQGKEIPALKRALPVFEEILTKQNLYSVPPDLAGKTTAQSQSQSQMQSTRISSPHPPVGVISSQLEQTEDNPSFNMDFLGLDFLDEWQMGHFNFTG